MRKVSDSARQCREFKYRKVLLTAKLFMRNRSKWLILVPDTTDQAKEIRAIDYWYEENGDNN